MSNQIENEMSYFENDHLNDVSNEDGRLFKKEPAINVISKEDFEDRVEKVFHLLWKTLSKSFGPYGAPTLIYNFPYSHVTKDGYTIMKNLSMDRSETLVDECIAGMAADICGRLNYSVGDGTTSAIIATNSIYQQYRKMKNELNNIAVLPRNVIKKYEEIKNVLLENLKNKVIQIRTEDLEQLQKNIYDVVYISSNGDEKITEMISDLYKELGSPAISCKKAVDGVTKKILIKGYQYELTLTDRTYINSDNDTMELTDSDIVIFTTKVTEATYLKILKPLAEESRNRGRHLIVAAPTYDENALQKTIRLDLLNEYKKSHDITMVLCNYRSINAHCRKLINDFSVLSNCDIIDRAVENSIMDNLAQNKNINSIFRIDTRDIDGLNCVCLNNNQFAVYRKGVTKLPDTASTLEEICPLIESPITLGYIKKCSLGLKTSVFTDLVYDEERYQDVLKEAEEDLKEKEKKYQKLGTFNIEVSQAQERLYALKLKMGVIEVGADSELSQAMLKDAVDDAIKAAASAYKHGIVKGCNVNLIQVIKDLYFMTLKFGDTDPTTVVLIKILFEGFMDVYRTVLGNAFKDGTYTSTYEEIKENLNVYEMTIDKFLKNISGKENIFTDKSAFDVAIVKQNEMYGKVSVHNTIIFYSLITNQVFDISTFEFSDRVINSYQTDEEILKATIDLISLLIVGNQMVVTGKHNF